LLWPVVDIIKRCQASEVESYFDQWEISINVGWFVANDSQ
jgi:hypothetical protein